MTSNKIVVVDFSGTLIKPFVAEEANLKRFALLGIPNPSVTDEKQMHASKSHYEIIKEHIEFSFGIEDDMHITSRNNKGEDIVLSGTEVKTQIMTDLFRTAMYEVAKEHGMAIFTDEIIDTLQKIQKKGYALAIVSGVRTDIISGILAITKCPLTFDYIYGQDAILSRDDNALQMKELEKNGKITYVIGDKLDDLTPAKELGAKSIFLKGSHSQGGEEAFADVTVQTAKDILQIII